MLMMRKLVTAPRTVPAAVSMVKVSSQAMLIFVVDENVMGAHRYDESFTRPLHAPAHRSPRYRYSVPPAPCTATTCVGCE